MNDAACAMQNARKLENARNIVRLVCVCLMCIINIFKMVTLMYEKSA